MQPLNFSARCFQVIEQLNSKGDEIGFRHIESAGSGQVSNADPEPSSQGREMIVARFSFAGFPLLQSANRHADVAGKLRLSETAGVQPTAPQPAPKRLELLASAVLYSLHSPRRYRKRAAAAGAELRISKQGNHARSDNRREALTIARVLEPAKSARATGPPQNKSRSFSPAHLPGERAAAHGDRTAQQAQLQARGFQQTTRRACRDPAKRCANTSDHFRTRQPATRTNPEATKTPPALTSRPRNVYRRRTT